MAQSDNEKRFLVGSTGCAIKVIRICSLKFLRFSFTLKNQLIFKCVRADFLRGRRPNVKMALRVGGGTRNATFEI